MVKLWRCEICGDPYVGDSPPENCPFCGAHRGFIKEAKDAKVNFDVQLNETDLANVKKALEVEISNAEFYFCAAEKTEVEESRLLFKALGKVEAEHASIWRKILKMSKEKVTGNDECSVENKSNLKESHDREERAIEFYTEAAKASENERVKEIFEALIEVERDHLLLSEERLLHLSEERLR
ncbi:MAG: ferritin [Candidatus Aenigmarchaeota archaeon]|nr:ferritin [Candidatus Aenigmarchaeota archaeon]